MSRGMKDRAEAEDSSVAWQGSALLPAELNPIPGCAAAVGSRFIPDSGDAV